MRLLWRHWVPEDMVPRLDDMTGGQATVWAREGWLLTTGNVIDYDQVHAQLAAPSAGEWCSASTAGTAPPPPTGCRRTCAA